MASGSLLPPPRSSGDAQSDSAGLAQWLGDVHKFIIAQSKTIGSLSGSDTGPTNPNNLPDPASTNLARAQQTANDAYNLASSAKALAEKLRFAGTVTVSDAGTTGVATFTAAEDDTAYFVLATQSAFTGTPAAGSSTVASITKTTANATLTVGTAPGVGNSVTFDVIVFRSPS